jgi:two-component system chemotaxis response regulator CheB
MINGMFTIVSGSPAKKIKCETKMIIGKQLDSEGGTGKTKPAGTIQVLVVDDSAVMRQVVTAVLSQERDICVTVASDPFIAMGKMKHTRPDVILLDLEMPKMNGLTFLRKIMKEDPIPVVVCSNLADKGSILAIRSLEEGAVEVITKPSVGIKDFLYESATMFIDTVRAATQARLRPRKTTFQSTTPALTAEKAMPASQKVSSSINSNTIIALGASTGGPESLHYLLQAMPEDAPGMVIVQHMPEVFTKAFANHLNRNCKIEVKEAANGDQVCRGRALIAPGNHHMVLQRSNNQYFVQVGDGPLVSRHRPSVDVLFHSVAEVAGSNAIGALMTGMGKDGAEGLLKMKRKGAFTIAQNEDSCVVFGMPKAAIDCGAVDEVIALDRMSEVILRKARLPIRNSRDI